MNWIPRKAAYRPGIGAPPRWKWALLQWRSIVAWRLRPAFLKHMGRPIRLRWWICYQLILRLDLAIQRELGSGRKAMFDNFEAGRSSPEFMRGKQAAQRARVLEARMLWLAYEGGAQYFDGSSHVELLHLAGMDIIRKYGRAR